MKSITKKLLSGLLLCAILCSALAFPIAADTTCSHALENGACKHCKEVAKKVTVAEGITLYAAGNKLLEPTDGVYYLFENDVVILKRGRVPSGMYFDSWKISSNANDYTLSGNQLCIGSADLAIEATFSANQKVNVIVNSPLFYVTGLSSMQFGAASISPVAGTSISVSYAGKMFMPNSKVVYWINENGMIVGMGDEITMTVSTPTTITAICDQGHGRLLPRGLPQRC